MSDEICVQGVGPGALLKSDGVEMQLEAEQLLACVHRILHGISHIRDGLRGHSNYRNHLETFSSLQAEGTKFSERLEQWSCRWKAQAPDCAAVAKALQFALKLETKRVFGQELAGIEKETGMHVIYARLEDAAGLLWNCYQNIFLLLASSLNLSMKEHRILEDIANRREESVRLETDLRTIREAVVRLQENSSTDLAALQQLLGIFQENAMYYLMFKDWGPFEDFIGQLKTAPERELLAVLHRFVIFLDTLTASVEKRAVLQALDSADEHRIGIHGAAG